MRLSVTLIAMLLSIAYSSAQETGDTLFVYKANGEVEAFPSHFITDRQQTEKELHISLQGSQTYRYEMADLDSVSMYGPNDIPRLETFKFNNKFNLHLLYDVEGEITDNQQVHLIVPAIGKRLIPSFTTSQKDAEVYINNAIQKSKESKQKFDSDLTYTVASPRHHVWNGTGMIPLGRDYFVHVEWPLYEAESLPRIEIETETGDLPLDKVTYIKSSINFDGVGIFPSLTDSVLIRGRGNSSWNLKNPRDKNPYRLKFDHKIKPFGMAKGKNWVLLANKLSGTQTTNAVAMKIAQLINTAYPNHIVPVELYINGEYRGHYNLTEKIGFSNNSIEIEDETQALLLEPNRSHDAYYFTLSHYDVPVNIKTPDYEDEDETLWTTPNKIRSNVAVWVNKLYNHEDISKYVDFDNLARFLFVNDLTRNLEINYPRSVFFYKEAPEKKYIFGPVWDFDRAYGYESLNEVFTGKASSSQWYPNSDIRKGSAWTYDLRHASEEFEIEYYKLFQSFKNDHFEELLEFCDDYYTVIRSSMESNKKKWKDNANYADVTQLCKAWLTERLDYMQSTFNEVISRHLYDVNLDSKVNITDVMLTVNDIIGKNPSTFYPDMADINQDGVISIADVMLIVNYLIRNNEQ